MRLLGLICSALLLATAPASAAALDTDTDTDTDTGFEPHPPPEVDILSPDDGDVFEGAPDAVVPVEISYSYMQPDDVSLRVDDVEVGGCVDEGACIVEVTLGPGSHKLQAFGSVSSVSEVVTVEVRAGSTGDSTGSSTGTGESETATDGEGGGEGGGEKSGCGCSAGQGAPGAWGLALWGLLALRRRRAG
ncbi:MYXO-CTERM sorting domain-containing protein [Nannocystis pusilla]|uniref:MYXO-CTERM sorting domain-containing protein n=1 Tax=Nannocystis pusilla TaxID=889268 RepID=UPI003DA482DC